MSLAFLAPQFLWALLALPAVLLLHFLRTRRRSRVVSALFLWRRAREAAEARRRFSASWLLLLQLLFVALAALALARPSLTLGAAPDRVVVIDASASMAARSGAITRLDQARDVVDSLLGEPGRVALIRAGLDSRVIAPLDSERSLIRERLRELTAGDRTAELQRALDLAAALAPSGEVHLISDGRAPPGESFVYHPVGGEAINYGITAFDTSIGQAYVAVSSSDPRPQEIALELRRDGRQLARSTLLVPARGQANATFPLDDEAGFLEARLEVPDEDALALDDVAFAGQRSLTVALAEASAPVVRALESIPGLTLRVGSEADSAGPDARVIFGVEPVDLPDGNVLLFAAAAEDPVYRAIRDWDQGSELLRFVDLRDTVVGLSPERQEAGEGSPGGQEAGDDALGGQEAGEDPPGAQDGWEVLARTADLTPVLSQRRANGSLVVRAAFHPSQTDMVFRPAFPTFMANVMNSFRGEATLPLGALLPEGATFDERPVERALLPGLYRTGETAIAASLLSAAETRLRAADPPAERGGRAPAVDEAGEASRNLWLVLLALAAALLLLEWLAWSRGGDGWLRAS